MDLHTHHGSRMHPKTSSNDDDEFLEWCGGLSSVSWLPLGPCYTESYAAVFFLCLVLVSLLAQGGHLALIHQLKATGRHRKGVSGLNGAYIGLALFLAGTHALHFFVGLAALRTWPFHITYHGAATLAWGVVVAFALYTSRLPASIDFRALSVLAALAYLLQLYSFFRLYFDAHGLPLPYIKASIWTAMLQTVVAILLCVLGWKRQAKSPSTNAIRAQLGIGYDELPGSEAAAAAGGSKPGTSADAAAGAAGGGQPGGEDSSEEDKRTWISLFWDACVYVWPEDPWLQARTIGCLGLLVCMRFINLAVPILYKRVVDTLAAASSGSGTQARVKPGGLGLFFGLLPSGVEEVVGAVADAPSGAPAGETSFSQLVWPWVVLYLAAVFFQGGAGGGIVGFINNCRSFLWIPVSQDAYRRISLRVFDHVLGLDLTFHLRKKTGEVTKVVDRGTNAMQNILSTILFNVLPQIFDVLAAATYLAQALEPTIAIIVFITVGSYIPLTIIITEWRGKLRREMNQTDQVKSARATDALLNYETVKYFTNERHESQQYAAAIDAYQSAEFRSMSSINVLNVVQSAIMFCGISCGLLVCAGGVSARTLTVGDTVLFLSLMAQLYGPLNFFGSYYRTIQQYMIDMENLLELLNRQPVVEDSVAARELVVTKGELSFDDVCFHYEPGHPVLRHVSWRVPGGNTIAFVGATGSGKSTITRLIFRFYEVSSGAVRLDGQDVRSVTQHSLRKAVGMVPQDTVLFNDTILHNIRYGNLEATDEQVHEAARLACIHDTIVNRFPKGYGTVVGERGLRLSGGEKQRVAFARALLKNPTVLVLDEATSALDTITEKKIQAALSALRASRTTVIVAHRLSTIMDAHTVVVMAQGQVAESGSHPELLAAGGLYAEMWAKQATKQWQQEDGQPSSAAVSAHSSVVDLQRMAAAAVVDGQAPHDASSSTKHAHVEATVAEAAAVAAAAAAGGSGAVSETERSSSPVVQEVEQQGAGGVAPGVAEQATLGELPVAAPEPGATPVEAAGAGGLPGGEEGSGAAEAAGGSATGTEAGAGAAGGDAGPSGAGGGAGAGKTGGSGGQRGKGRKGKR